MSIKYTYKGTEHNIDGNTTVLTTSGKYLEDNITIETEGGSSGGGSSDFVGIPREVTSEGVFGFPIENFTFTLPSNAKDIYSYALRYAFQNCISLTSVDLSNLSTVSGGSALNYTFQGCTNLTSVDLSNLSVISGNNALQNAFVSCTNLTSVDLSNLSVISGTSALRYAFQNCTSLTSVDLSNLSEISGSSALRNAFQNCTSLKELSFPALTTSSFGSYDSQFDGMLQSVTGCIVHFPNNLESVLSFWSSIRDGFRGNDTTVLFDLPATT